MMVSGLLHTLVDNTSRQGASLSIGYELQGPRFSLGLCQEERICNLYPTHSLVTVPTALSELPLERRDTLQTVREVYSLHPVIFASKLCLFLTLKGQASFVLGLMSFEESSTILAFHHSSVMPQGWPTDVYVTCFANPLIKVSETGFQTH